MGGGIKFGMSNVFSNKGFVNTKLQQWCEKNGFYVEHLDMVYNACGSDSENVDEVYIHNYHFQKFQKASLIDF